MTWFVFCLLSITALAYAELTQQHLLNIKSKFDPRSSAVLTFLFQAFLTIPIILITNIKYELFEIFNPQLLPKFLAVAFIGSIGMIYYLKSFQVKNISISTIFVSISVLVSTTLGIIFLNETLYFYKILGIILILGSIISVNFSKLELEKNHFYGLVAGLLFGTTYTLDKMIVLNIHPLLYIFWSFTAIALFGFIFGPKTIINKVKKAEFKDYKPIMVSGFGYFLFNFFTYTSYTYGGEIGRVDAINNSQVFLIILAEYFILKNKSGLVRKLGTAAVAYTGVLILGFY